MTSDKKVILEQSEAAVAAGGLSLESTLSLLRRLPLKAFAEALLDMPDPRLPALSQLLPEMASAQTQQAFTGSHGSTLLVESVAFVKAVIAAWERFGNSPLARAKILDYGCGYGRLLRLFLHAADPANLLACDPWDKAIDLCRQARIPCDLQVTSYLPDRLPYPDQFFHLAYAFSVFTHTSERATLQALQAIHRTMQPGGMLAATIRPVHYWAIHQSMPPEERAALEAAHGDLGFAFKPHRRAPVDGDITYGDTSMSVETLARLGPGWSVLHEEILPESPFQRIVYLRADEPAR
jgi:SAM-dependent methyltransferase